MTRLPPRLMNGVQRHSLQGLMPSMEAGPRPDRGPLTRRNVVVLTAAIGCLVAGYLTLQAGSASAGAVLLVLGYCVLFPLAIAL